MLIFCKLFFFSFDVYVLSIQYSCMHFLISSDRLLNNLCWYKKMIITILSSIQIFGIYCCRLVLVSLFFIWFWCISVFIFNFPYTFRKIYAVRVILFVKRCFICAVLNFLQVFLRIVFSLPAVTSYIIFFLSICHFKGIYAFLCRYSWFLLSFYSISYWECLMGKSLRMSLIFPTLAFTLLLYGGLNYRKFLFRLTFLYGLVCMWMSPRIPNLLCVTVS